MRVLIADDNVFYADALSFLLQRECHAVVGIADCAADALALSRSGRPDLALIDLTLRDGCTGPELGCELGRGGVNVLFVTATPTLAPMAIGVLGVLGKPAGDARLLRAIAAAHDQMR